MSSTDGLCIFACIFLSIIGEVEGVVSSPPSNAVAEVNGEAIFNCSATPSGPLVWVLTRDGISSVGEIRITSGCIVNAGFQDHYRTEQPGGSTTCNLIVLNITMEQAGVYHCTDTDTYRALLTVLDSSPSITYNNTPDVIERENVVITCTLNFNGSVYPAPTLRPHFYWTDYTGRNVSSFNDSWPGNDSAVSQLSVTAGRQDIMPCTCHVYLKLIPTTTPMYASNTPTVTKSASSPAITVLYSPGNISIVSSVTPKDECVQKQENLTCTADAKPQAQYEWLDLNSNITSQGSIKSITSGGQYQCTAYNDMRNTTYNQTKTAEENTCSAPPTTMSTTTQSTTSVPIGAVVGGVIGCVLAVSVIAIFLFIGYYKMLPCLIDTKERSALNKRENSEENGSAGNGRRSVNPHLSPNQPGNQAKAVNPYQNESRENIELDSSHHSRNLLLTDSSTSSTSPKVKPHPTPNKPTPNTSGRAQNYVATEPAAMDQNHTTYADLPFMPHAPPTIPVQFLDGTEDPYAEIKKT